MNAILSMQDLTIGYRISSHAEKRLAGSISSTVIEGELVCLLGPNGAGKSTLIRTLAGMQVPLSGAVWLGQENVHKLSTRELAKRLSVVLTDRVEVGNLTAYELVSLGRHPFVDWTGRLTNSDRNVIRWAIEVTGIGYLAPRAVSELSDGERQRVMIARALAQEPKIMVLDEPTAFLDLPRRIEIIGLLRSLAHDMKCTILLATHDLDIALRTSDKIWLLSSKGEFTTGIPEELILDGSFESVFASDMIKFDNASGSFKIVRQNFNVVGLQGEGLVAFWTSRALEREGFDTVNDNHNMPIRINIQTSNGIYQWHVFFYDKEHVLDSLSAAMSCLKDGLGKGDSSRQTPQHRKLS